MGRFVNPDNSAFQKAVNSEIYVDKTGFLSYTNKVIDTKQAFICNSRPRRFGKSTTADMLAAYYSKGCDSENLFADLAVSDTEDFHKYLNKYDVIHFDVQWFITENNISEIVNTIQNNIVEELKKEYPDILDSDVTGLPDAMSIINQETGNRFIVIIDEWDVLIRDEAQNQNIQEAYIGLLRRMFKGIEPTKYMALAFLTGILPIKKLKTQSALNNFDEFTMLGSGNMAPYIGFTEEEVKALAGNFVYIPKPEYRSDYLALIVELKWNQKAQTALQQIKEKQYPDSVLDYTGDILLVGINYDKKTKEHQCLIERYEKK